MIRCKSLIFSLLILFSSLDAKPPHLTPHTTRKKAEEIFQAHVTHKELTTEISRRTLQNFLEELDPYKLYLFHNEVIKFASPSDQLLNTLIRDFKKEKFTFFEELYQTMIKAIERRNKLEETISSYPLPKDIKASDLTDLPWCENKEELSERLLKLRALQLESAKKLDCESSTQFLKRLKKVRLSREKEIVQENPKESKKQCLVYFMKAFTSALDNHTAYFTPSEASEFMFQMQHRLFGIGAALQENLNGFVLTQIIEGSPAYRTKKLKIGDRIIAINHEPVVGLGLSEAVELIRGPKGTAITLTIVKESTEEKLDVEVVRDEIVLKDSRFESNVIPYGDGVIAHIRLFSFYQDPNDSSASDIKHSIEKIQENHKMLGLILDLRGNAGGILPQAVAVTGLFIQKGVVVSIKDSNEHIYHLRNFEDSPAWDGPLVVLTNKTSASASEIVAQTLQDYGRALIVGDESTWGKGSYQTSTLQTKNLEINPQGEYKVTGGLYYTVSGKTPQLVGAKADVIVPGSFAKANIGESVSKFPIKNDTIAPSFNDTLSDIHAFHRGKMLRLYKKDRQKCLNIYPPYLKTLKTNSTLRINQNKNYQNFIKQISKEEYDLCDLEEYGQNDLQLEECCNVLKDFIILTSSPQNTTISQGNAE